MNLAQLTQRTFFSWCPPVPMTHALFLPTLPRVSLNSERRDFREIYHLELCVSRTFSLCVMYVCRSLHCCICSHLLQEEALLMMTQ